MERRAASGNLDRVQPFEVGLGNVLHLVQKNPAGVERDAAFHSFTHGARLLVNLLQHEMLEAALFRLDRVPGDPLHDRLDWIAGKIGNTHRVLGHHGNFAVAQKENVARVLENCGDVGGDKVLALAQTDNYRRSQPGGNNSVGFVRGEHG